jgi:Thiamine pyrophosphate enzyme, C-terminal TPP binding domain
MMTSQALDRRDAVVTLLKDRGSLLVISGLGSPSFDVHRAGDTDANYYLWGAMGAAALMGLGLAQARPDRNVLVITGDGEQLMGLGGLATIAIARPRNLIPSPERFESEASPFVSLPKRCWPPDSKCDSLGSSDSERGPRWSNATRTR